MVMRHFHLLLFVSISFTSLSQKEDQYLQKIATSTTRRSLKDSVLVNKLNKISIDSCYTNAEKGEDYARQAIKISKKKHRESMKVLKQSKNRIGSSI